MKKEFWTQIPNYILYTKKLNPDEKEIYYIISNYLNGPNFSTLTNAQLKQLLNVQSERTVSSRLASLKNKGFINIYQNKHVNQRRIYLNHPKYLKNPLVLDKKPTDKDCEEKKQKIIDSIKHAIVIGSFDFDVLIQRLLDSPYLQTVKTGETQFAINENQLIFLAEFKKLGKKLDCQIAIFPQLDYTKLLSEIKKSDFLLNSSNLNLYWFMQNSEKVLAGDYRNTISTESKPNFTGRKYSSDEWNSLYQTIDEIKI